MSFLIDAIVTAMFKCLRGDKVKEFDFTADIDVITPECPLRAFT